MDFLPAKTACASTRAIRVSIRKHCVIFASFAILPVTDASAFDLHLNFTDEQQQAVSGVVAEIAGRPVASAPTQPAIMDQINRRFEPMVLLVQTGEHVSFPNSDNVRHHVYSFSDIRQFSTPLYADEHVDPILFDNPGIAVLGCNIHDSMVAYVYVSQWQDRAISNENGLMTLTELAEKPQTLSIWHPWLQTPDNTLEIDLSTASDAMVFNVTLPVKSPTSQFGFRALVPGAAR